MSEMVRLSKNVKEFLDSCKIHPRQSYDEVLRDIINRSHKSIDVDRNVEDALGTEDYYKVLNKEKKIN